MTTEQASRPSQASGVPPGPPPSLPDINTQTYPFDLVLRLLDEVSCFNLFSIPESSGGAISAAGGNGVIGVRVGEKLHRFDVGLEPPQLASGLRVADVVGEELAKFRHRWLLIPDDFRAMPDREPPPTVLDPSRSQRFVMLDGTFAFKDGEDGFRGFGTGRTFPMTVKGKSRLLAGAVGNIMEGAGRFRGLEGTYTYCGILSPRRGFSGNLLIRVIDPQKRLRAGAALPPLRRMPYPERELTFLTFRGQKKNQYEKTSLVFGAGGQPQGFKLSQELRNIQIDAAAPKGGEVGSAWNVGAAIGGMNSQVFLNILAPGAPGTGVSPIPFHSYNEYTFLDREGRSVAGFAAEGGEGRTFTLAFPAAPGQQALRFGAFQTLAKGTGALSGVQGLMTDNSAVGVAPHATSTLYTLCILDPQGKYRSAHGQARR